jgi:hypothetical protein
MKMGEIGKRLRVRFEAMIEELRAHPGIYVASAELGAGATKAQLAEAEQALGHALPADMRDIYEEINGLEVIWRLVRPGEDRAELLAGEPDFNDLLDYSCPYPAVSMLAPIQRLVLDWSDIGNFLPEDYAELFGVEVDVDEDEDRLWIHELDQYSMWIMAGVTFAPDNRAVVLFGDDHGACFSDHKQISVPTYLELVCRSWAWRERAKPLKQMFGWDEVVEPAALPSPTLDELIALIIADDDEWPDADASES